MTVVDCLREFIAEKQLLSPQDRVLLAVSGGKDSMLMAYVFKAMGYDAIVAHCNFQLRGKESDLDEELVREFAETLQFPIFVNHFDTEAHASLHKISIQMAARELRYTWFEALRQQEGCAVIAIGQHANDQVETVLLNLTRTTGIQGLTGIKPKQGQVIRPLLELSAEQVRKAVEEYNIPFRDDQSNFSSKYARNKIRLEIIPKFEEIQPHFAEIMLQNIAHFEESYGFIQDHVSRLRDQLFTEQDGWIFLEKDQLKAHIPSAYLFFELLKPFGFLKSTLEDVLQVLDREMGQRFESPSHELLLDRNQLLIRRKKEAGAAQMTWHLSEDTLAWHDRVFSMRPEEVIGYSLGMDNVQVDAALLQFPLTIRTWQLGDYFVPLGMSGRKKVSDFFIGLKINRFEKEEIPLLINGNGEVIWIVGKRLDNRYRVTENTKKVLTLVCK